MKRRLIFRWILALVAAVSSAIAVAYGLAQLLRQYTRRPAPSGYKFTPPVVGLSEAEAEALQTPIDLDALKKATQKQFLRYAVRHNLLTTFNIDLFLSGVVMLLLGSPLSALGTLIIIILNLSLNVFQEGYTKHKLDKLMQSLHPQAAVIRDGKIKSIDLLKVVTGDMLAIGTGDQILVDGILVSKQAINVDALGDGAQGQQEKRRGDRLEAGSVCLNGRAIYRATNVDTEKLAKTAVGGVQLLPTQLTPLQKLIEYALHTLFGLVVAFSIILVLDSIVLQTNLVSEAYRDAFGLVFAIAPTSLFFILVVHYAVGSLRMSDFGALVYRAQSIESLANVSTLCLSRRSVFNGLQVTIDPIAPADDEAAIDENLMRHILGDMVHSIPIQTQTERMTADALPGEPRTAQEIAHYLSMYGWSGIVFDDDDLRGTFIMGETAVLDPHLAKEKTTVLDEVEETLNKAQHQLNHWQQRLKSTPAPSEPSEGEPVAKNGFWRRLGRRLQPLIQPMEGAITVPQITSDLQDQSTFLFAYLPDKTALHDPQGAPFLPYDLIPLATVHIAETILPEARETVQAFLEAGVAVKLFSSGSLEQATATAQSLGLVAQGQTAVSGSTFAQLSADEKGELVMETAVFGQLTPEQKADIVQSLQRKKAYVGVVGHTTSDVPAMRQADLRVVLQSGSQAALQTTDIVMLQDSLVGLPVALKTGQRLVNGVLDTFKLYLSQVLTQFLLILFVFIFAINTFPFHPTQGSVISIFTITIPNILLPFWSSPGHMTAKKMRWSLANFILPTAVSLTALALIVYTYFFWRTSDETYANLATTYAMLGAGWLRLLFVQPPSKFWTGGDELAGDKRVYGLALASALIFAVVLTFPLFQEWLRVSYLASVSDYLIVITAVIVWMLSLRFVWHWQLLRRFVEMMSDRFQTAATP